MFATYEDVQELRSLVTRVVRGMLRHGKVSSVDVDAGTLVVSIALDEGEHKPHPMPWFQRSTEHRPPSVGDHATVIDPSLGNGGAIALVGWPSLARPPAGGGGDVDVIAKTERKAVIDSPEVEIGQAPEDYAALAAKVLSELNAFKEDLDAFKVAFDGHTHAVATTGTQTAQSGTAAPVLSPAPTAHTPGSVACEQVKVS